MYTSFIPGNHHFRRNNATVLYKWKQIRQMQTNSPNASKFHVFSLTEIQ